MKKRNGDREISTGLQRNYELILKYLLNLFMIGMISSFALSVLQGFKILGFNLDNEILETIIILVMVLPFILLVLVIFCGKSLKLKFEKFGLEIIAQYHDRK